MMRGRIWPQTRGLHNNFKGLARTPVFLCVVTVLRKAFIIVWLRMTVCLTASFCNMFSGAKKTLISGSGFSPYKLVFGSNPAALFG